MPKILKIVVDPFLLCLPNPCTTYEQLEDFINALIGWKNLISRKDTCVLLSNSTQLALNDDDEYPHRSRLSLLIKQYDIADEKTISKLVDGILNRTLSFEDYTGIKDVLFEENTLKVDPLILLDRLKLNSRVALSQTLVSISIFHQTTKSDDFSDSIVLASAFGTTKSDPVPVPDHVELEVEIYEVDYEQSVTNCFQNLPTNLADKIQISFCHDSLLNAIGLWSVWNCASDVESIIEAINLCIKNLTASGTKESSICEFIVGGKFIDSVEKWGAATRKDYAMIVIESCARIVLGIPKNALKEFREDSKSTSKQRSRGDGSLGFRTHLTKSGVGLRLMFWKHTNGKIEFANIGGKDELEIL